MSEMKLVLRDANRDIHATRDAGFVERIIAALSAEPETLAELDAAIERQENPLGDCHNGELRVDFDAHLKLSLEPLDADCRTVSRLRSEVSRLGERGWEKFALQEPRLR